MDTITELTRVHQSRPVISDEEARALLETLRETTRTPRPHYWPRLLDFTLIVVMGLAVTLACSWSLLSAIQP